MRSCWILLGGVLLTGCHAPTPHFNPWVGQGPTTVTPPITGSLGAPRVGAVPSSGYYQLPTGLQAAPRGAATSNAAADGLVWNAPATPVSAVRQASFEAAASPEPTVGTQNLLAPPQIVLKETPPRVVESALKVSDSASAAPSLAERLDGMRVNDGTALPPPSPPILLTQPALLPQPALLAPPYVDLARSSALRAPGGVQPLTTMLPATALRPLHVTPQPVWTGAPTASPATLAPGVMSSGVMSSGVPSQIITTTPLPGQPTVTTILPLGSPVLVTPLTQPALAPLAGGTTNVAAAPAANVDAGWKPKYTPPAATGSAVAR